MVDPHEDPIELVDSKHDEWREQFAGERDRLEQVFNRRNLTPDVRRIDHVGSSAVPGLAAKDIVDLDIVVDDRAVPRVSDAIETELGGTKYENSEQWHPVFRRADGQRFNDHVFAASAPGWRISVATVEVLRNRPALRAEYEELKRRAVDETDGLEEYGRSKTAFLTDLLEHARTRDFEFEVPAPDELE